MFESQSSILTFVTYRVAVCSVIASIITSILVLKKRFRTRTTSINEPPSPPSKFPFAFIDHAIGISKRRVQYFSDIGVERREPMSKISFLGVPIYIVGSVKMLPLMQRQPRVISSRSFFATFVCALVGCSKRSLRNFEANLGANSQGDSMLLEGVRVTKRILNSRSGTEMNHNAAKLVIERFKQMEMGSAEVEVDLFDWIKYEMMHLVSESAYGPDNPFWDPKVAAAFWEFEEASVALCLTNFLPKFVSYYLVNGVHGRETVVRALDKYLRAGEMVKGSPIVNAHYPLWSAGLDESDIPRFEAVSALGTFANTVPTSFWMLYHVFSDPKLLADIRTQITEITTSETSQDGSVTVNRIDLRKLRTTTVVFSTVEEVSRYRATGIGIRVVTEDTIVGEGENCYQLKKNAWILIANRALHTEKTEWGEDADTFVASRFMAKTPHMSFRGFGNGASACCGKNFAMYHIATFVAIMVMRFDMAPVDGVWKEPTQDARESAGQVARPVHSPKVRMIAREDVKKVAWEFSY